MRSLRKVLILGGMISILALPVGLIGGGHKLEQSPSFCDSCHEMAASYKEWKSSGAAMHHPTCIECHSGVGLAGILESEVRGVRMIGKHLIGGHSPGQPIKADVPDYFCLKCHAREKTVSEHSLLKIEGQRCADCHKHREGWSFVGQFPE